MGYESPWQKFIDSAATDAWQEARRTPAKRPIPERVRNFIQARRRPEPTIENEPRPYRDLRLLPVALAAVGAAALGTRWSASTGMLAALLLGIGALSLLVLSLVFRRLPHALLFVVPLAVSAAVVFSAATHVEGMQAGEIQADTAAEAQVVVTIRAASDAAGMSSQWGGERYRVEADVERVISEGRVYGSTGRLLIVGAERWSTISTGDRIRTAGKLGAAPPGSGFTASLYASTAPQVQRTENGWTAVTGRMRKTFRDSTVGLEPDVRGLLPGMVLGDRSLLTEELETAMKGTGLTHLTAVSGSNCAFVLAFVFLFARTCRAPRWLSAVLGIAALIGFVLLVRPDPSVLRAAVMGGLGALAVLSGRGRLSFSLLLLAAVILIIADPWIHAEYGFILSVLATTGLIVLGPPLVTVLATAMPRAVAVIISIPVAAQLLCTPVILTLQPTLPTYSVPANIAASPVVPFITIVGMAAVLVGAAHPGLAAPLTNITALAADWVAGVAQFFFGLPAASTPWLEGPAGVLLATGASLGAIGIIMALSRRIEGREARSGKPPGKRRRMRGAIAVVGVLGTCLVLGLVLAPVFDSFRWGKEAEWDVAACDVGQGDSFAVRTGPDSAIVIDAGPEAESMDQCLDNLGVTTVDLLVLTHSHLDHYGGAAGVFQNRMVREVAYSSAAVDVPREVRRISESVTLRPLDAGDTGQTARVSWRTLWPLEGARPVNENNASTVLLMTLSDDERALSILFTGDLEDDAASRLLAQYPELGWETIDVLKLAHHGARNGGTDIVERIRPRIGMISVGAENTYGHPGDLIINSLKSVGAVVLRTDQDGMFILDIEGTQLLARRW